MAPWAAHGTCRPPACSWLPRPGAAAAALPRARRAAAGGRLDAVSSSARWEDVVGYSRAVKRGPFIYVSGGWVGGWEGGAQPGCHQGRADASPCPRRGTTVTCCRLHVPPAAALSHGALSVRAVPAPAGTSAVDQASGRVMYRRDAYKQVQAGGTGGGAWGAGRAACWWLGHGASGGSGTARGGTASCAALPCPALPHPLTLTPPSDAPGLYDCGAGAGAGRRVHGRRGGWRRPRRRGLGGDEGPG